ncbi:MAG: hypothetical protein EOP21_07095 [Hyphomicrobiales bacterium]|nr:MAG: hypothetical protein EOP21_07095 [Hyphomicrobiales bacterium]
MPITASKFFSTDRELLTARQEDRFFTDLKTSNQTFKRTASHRFEELDASCAGLFAASGMPLREVLDIGISSGRTTLELAQRLRAAGQAPKIVGTDLSLEAYLVPLCSGVRVLVDEAGHPLQYDLLGQAVRAWTRRADYVTGMAAFRRLLHRISSGRIAQSLGVGKPAPRRIQLLSPRLADEPDIQVEKNDIFSLTDRFVGRFDFIRAANILNLGYFDEKALRSALENVAKYLSGPDAWLLVARTCGTATAAK